MLPYCNNMRVYIVWKSTDPKSLFNIIFEMTCDVVSAKSVERRNYYDKTGLAVMQAENLDSKAFGASLQLAAVNGENGIPML